MFADEGIIIGKDAKPSRSESIGWPTPPEEIGTCAHRNSSSFNICMSAYIKPYIFSVLPPGSLHPTDTDPAHKSNLTSIVQIRSSITLLATQTYHYPFKESSSPAVPSPSSPPVNATIRLMTPSPTTNSSLFLVSTPTDRTAATAEGSSIWHFEMKPWPEQIDELVLVGQYSDALKLLETIDIRSLPDKVSVPLTDLSSCD